MNYDFTWAMNNGKCLERMVHRKRIKAILSLADFKHKKVLDVGCNTGILTTKLRQLDYTGIDISRWCIDKAMEYRTSSDYKFMIMDCCDLKFNSSTFDLIIITDVLEHITEKERKKTLNEVYRVLKPNGLVVVSVPSKYHPQNIDFLRQIVTSRKITKEMIDNPFTKRELIKLLSDFTLLKMRRATFFCSIMGVFQK